MYSVALCWIFMRRFLRGQPPPFWSAPPPPPLSTAWKPSCGWVPRRMLKAIYVTLDVLVSASGSPCVCYERRQTDELLEIRSVLFVVSPPELRPVCVVVGIGCSLTNVCVCVCVCSQHEEKEKALKEQLSHLSALLPTLQVTRFPLAQKPLQHREQNSSVVLV